ncbi:sigma-70 family RNA polymerase sigma factor [Streptomyces longwoodensis]|uniref:sigma-70 family RNA polymerase sigma factor n=1 Tax=Streptomyces longwoodensis TaxID=68231 RepID=UPI002E7FF30B|nr:sigma-70 family RNA polymerase sigma factor [Streptomyces longwoodensis]WTI43049.1 sigma-70 family RNA polymerase sigma factor [Streptomyces longwoodensis]WTI49368.1 sigma-70 family RNA polymerase sigma factor [Streptomyces longwoodensis]WUC55813.1 sigma-70 family RNA polymerase sigma factor [Streptomyces longwoodensis]WUC62068.1 sigma-70 family RNA polymerase sigma factor [Streptomyces longwoodensis]
MPDPTPAHGAREDDGHGHDDLATRTYVEHRELLFSLVYNMLGSVADTEDVLQDTWLSWAARNRAQDADRIGHPRAYLVRIAVNKALARHAALSRSRETYIGPWLPEPLATPRTATPAPADTGDAADAAELAESVSMALLVVLETLTPLERAVFVLHEVFGYAHPETAALLGRSPSAVRQLAHRASRHVQARRPRYRADPHLRQQVTERFAAAVSGGDLRMLLELLAPDVTLWADGGGKAPAAGPRPVHGRDKVAHLLAGGTSRAPRALDIRYQHVNGDPSALLFDGESLFAVLVLDLAPDSPQVRGIYFLTNPDKLRHLTTGKRNDQ